MKASSENKKKVQFEQRPSQILVSQSTVKSPQAKPNPSPKPKGHAKQLQPINEKKLTHSDLKIRSASPSDAEFASKLLFLSSPQFSQNFIGLGKEERAKKIIKQMFIFQDHRLSYEHMLVIELRGQKVGLINSIAGEHLRRSNRRFGLTLIKFYKMKGKIALFKRILPLLFLKESGKKDYYIAGIGVLPRFQSQGIGKTLVKQVEKQARQKDYASISVLVPIQNTHARRFFEQLGYKVKSVVLESNKRVKLFGSGYQRMSKSL